jgi:hypothetical protein
LSMVRDESKTEQPQSALSEQDVSVLETALAHEDLRATKAARIREGLRRFVHLTASSERFLQEKWAELDDSRSAALSRTLILRDNSEPDRARQM